jgi:1-acyl-sn-glycerol-3-phosphate acyltransferase
MAPRAAAEAPSPVALRSPRRIAFFDRVFTRFARRHLCAVRLARWGRPRLPAEGGPVVVFANHPSWWDGMAVMLLWRRLLGERELYVPMDAEALNRYGFMRRIGVFGVEPGARGAAGFMRVAGEVLSAPDRLLWINAPGRFSDARERPVPIAPGMSRLPELAPGATFLPLALEYTFWNERAPEMLAAFGEPVPAAAFLAEAREARPALMAASLAATMDRLAADSIARDPALFETLLEGRQGMGGVWQAWRRAGALLRGQSFDPRHDQRRRRMGA